MRMHAMGHHGRKMWPMAMMMGGWGRRWGSDWGGDFAGDWQGKGGRGPRGRSRMFGSGELRLVLLGLIGEAPRHGYELIKAIEELSGGNYAPSPGVVYPTLNLLTDEGLIAEQPGEGARKAFAATEAGRAELDGRGEEFARIVERLKALAEERERHSAPQLKRAMGNLFMAVKGRAMDSGFDRDTLHAIADVLDEAARKIERM
ncbi:PadR family transcriptional regulator [Novosphingobium sp.]|uniref:PadR family transcriptional regulator n=1 Tax=Novosphingobium sp. TaxID=1874826 RepID=UPI0025CC2CCC|nr:PadR family transcriptional regulator [Novosphingobium sp.]